MSMKFGYDVFEKIDIRVGTIKRVEDVQGAEKLVKLIVDFGDHNRLAADLYCLFFTRSRRCCHHGRRLHLCVHFNPAAKTRPAVRLVQRHLFP